MRWVLLNVPDNMWEPTIKEMLTQIAHTVSPDREQPPFAQLLDMFFVIQEMAVQGSTIVCPKDQPPLNISPEWMWTCTVLRHAAKMYVRHNNSLTKQEKRELRRPRK